MHLMLLFFRNGSSNIIALADFTPKPSKHSQKNAASSTEIVFEFIKSIMVNGSTFKFTYSH